MGLWGVSATRAALATTVVFISQPDAVVAAGSQMFEGTVAVLPLPSTAPHLSRETRRHLKRDIANAVAAAGYSMPQDGLNARARRRLRKRMQRCGARVDCVARAAQALSANFAVGVWGKRNRLSLKVIDLNRFALISEQILSFDDDVASTSQTLELLKFNLFESRSSGVTLPPLPQFRTVLKQAAPWDKALRPLPALDGSASRLGTARFVGIAPSGLNRDTLGFGVSVLISLVTVVLLVWFGRRTVRNNAIAVCRPSSLFSFEDTGLRPTRPTDEVTQRFPRPGFRRGPSGLAPRRDRAQKVEELGLRGQPRRRRHSC